MSEASAYLVGLKETVMDDCSDLIGELPSVPAVVQKPVAKNKGKLLVARKPSGKSVRTDRARAIFLEQLAATCNVTHSARVAGMGRTAAYAWRKEDPDFAKDWDEAEQEAVDLLEQEAWKRATVDKSDRMLEILLKAHRPKKYVEKRLLGSDPDNPLPENGIKVDVIALAAQLRKAKAIGSE